MAEAILLRNLPEGLGEVYVWKKYEVVENVSYKWNRYDVVTTVTYKWEKYNVLKEYKFQAKAMLLTLIQQDGHFYKAYSSYSYNNDPYSPKPFSPAGTEYNVVASKLGSLYDVGSTYAGQYSYAGLVDEPGTIRYWTDRHYIASSRGNDSYGQVTSTNSNAYPSNGASGSYWYVSAGSDTTYSKGSTSYPDVSSTSETAYPNPGHQDGYWYENRQQVITYSMGSYIEDVFSTNPQRYPTNGIDGAYWYVLQS